ncbi:MAG: class I SAM-dependent methyltransferase [Alphaproteobacteria bacterium]|nr:class I SAM-dependent methyltransferase [Alphaproteobacteria bacterium]
MPGGPGGRHRDPEPSAWVAKWAGLVRPGGTVLDVAAGAGRHARHLLGRGFRVVAADIDVSELGDLAGRPDCEVVKADLENAPWPFPGRRFEGIVVTNYLCRTILPILVDSLTPGGVYIHETFMQGNERFGRPSKPEFLLAPGELLERVRGRLTVAAYEAGETAQPPAMRQRIAAIDAPSARLVA